MANGKDGLFDSNISPSLYVKAQGLPVKIWSFFANGRLEYWVLPADDDPAKKQKTTHMNGDRYEWLVTNKFADWRRACFSDDQPVHLVQDHEKCLWQQRNKDALKKAGCLLVQNYPKHSPDLNAIENWWATLRKRLQQTEPVEVECRSDFLSRLRRTVNWLNENKWEEALALSTNQKKRADDILELEGARSKW